MASRTTILCAEDDPDDQALLRDAFAEVEQSGDLRFVEDGEELLDYLRGKGRFDAGGSAPSPALVIVDLNMPRVNGREAIVEIRSDEALRSLPIVVMTTSSAPDDIRMAYAAGANSYIVKPVSFHDLVLTLIELQSYWFRLVRLPEA